MLPILSDEFAKPRTVDYGPVFAALPLAAAIVDASKREPVFAAFSDTFLAQLELTGSSAKPDTLKDAFPAETGLRVLGAVSRCKMMRKPTKTTINHRRGAGFVRLDVVARPIQGGVSGMVLLTVEPPSRAMTLADQRRRMLDQLAPLSAGTVYIYDVARRRTRYVHNPLPIMLGMPPNASLRDILSHMHPDDLGTFLAHMEEVRTMGDSSIAQATIRMQASDGKWLWILSRARVLGRDAAGAVRKVIGAASDISEHHAMTEALEGAAQALANAETSERRKVGRELHDTTVQHLVAIDLSLTALEHRVVLGPQESAVLRDTRSALSAAQREIRTFSFMLHPPDLEERGLRETLGAFIDGFARRTGLNISLSVSGEDRPLTADVELGLFRIAQEALMNVHRHAHANAATVRLSYENKRVALEIADDGVGLPGLSGAVDISLGVGLGVGISGMKARMIQLGGELQLHTTDSGMRVKAFVPLAEAAKGDRPSPDVPRLLTTLKAGAVQGIA